MKIMKEEVKVVLMRYNPEARLELLETEVNSYPYLAPINGYEEVKRENDWLILKKEESVSVMIKKEAELGTPTYDIKSQICDFYHEEKMSRELFDRFCKDVRSNAVKLYLNSDGLIIE